MAELELYGNANEPPFPCEALAISLSWVPEYIAQLTPRRGRNLYQARLYDTLINIILVFARARTSALFANREINVARSFVRRLNSLLVSLPNASHHTLEIVERSHATFFIVCKNSPRFIWKYPLSHREVGLNLDFAAAGHFGFKTKAISARIFEITGGNHISIFNQAVYLDYADMPKVRKFCERQTALFNSTMVRLKLPYRFSLHWWNSKDTSEEVARVMANDQPPSTEWWEANYLFIKELPHDAAFCKKDSPFQEYWRVLRLLYEFILSLHPSLNFPIPVEYSEELEALFRAVEQSMQSGMPSAALYTLVEQRVSEIEIDHDALRRKGENEIAAIRRSDLSCFIKWQFERMMVRRKRSQLQYSVIERWPAEGDQKWNPIWRDSFPSKKGLWRIFLNERCR